MKTKHNKADGRNKKRGEACIPPKRGIYYSPSNIYTHRHSVIRRTQSHNQQSQDQENSHNTRTLFIVVAGPTTTNCLYFGSAIIIMNIDNRSIFQFGVIKKTAEREVNKKNKHKLKRDTSTKNPNLTFENVFLSADCR